MLRCCWLLGPGLRAASGNHVSMNCCFTLIQALSSVLHTPVVLWNAMLLMPDPAACPQLVRRSHVRPCASPPSCQAVAC